MNRTAFLAALALAAATSGCAKLGPDHAPPRAPAGLDGPFGVIASPVSPPAATRGRAGAAHRRGGGAGPAAVAAKPEAGEADLARWWRAFRDPLLDDLIARGLAGSPELRLASARFQEARALRGSARAGLFPEVSARSSYAYERISRNSPQLSIFGAARQSQGAAGGQSFTPELQYDNWQAAFDSSWEIDVWGAVRREVEAAGADADAAREAAHDALVSLLAEVARNYLDLRGLQRRAAIAREGLDSQRRTLALVRERAGAGLASELDAARAAAQAATTEARLPEIDAAARIAMHAIALLLGQAPGALVRELSASPPRPGDTPALPARVPVGVPEDLLRRRPDLRRAERQVAAATARVGVATADLFPRVSLTGSFGRQAVQPSLLGYGGSNFFAVGPALRWRILDAGRVRNEIAAAEARTEAALALWERTALAAAAEAEDAIARLDQERSRRAALAAAVRAARRAVALAREQYGQGLLGLLDVLEAERSALSTQDELARSETTAATALVSLYKALGGGWDGVETRPGR